MDQRNRTIIGLLLSMLAITTYGCDEKSTSSAPIIRPVRAMKIEGIPAFAGRSFPGTVEAVNAVELAFRVGGPLVSFPGDTLGKRVNKGDLIAQIDPRDYDLRVRDAAAALEKSKSELDAMRMARPEDIEKLKAEVDRAQAATQFAKAEYDRTKGLFDRRVVTQSEVELADAKYRLAEADVTKAKESLRIGEQGARPEEIKSKMSEIEGLDTALKKAHDELADTKLLAPFEGAISATYVDNHELVQPRQRIVRMVNTGEFEMRVDIPENLIALVPKVSDPVIVLKNVPDRPIPAKITEVGAEASRATRTYPVKLRFTPPKDLEIRPGLTGIAKNAGSPVDAPNETAAGNIIPADAVFMQGENASVWIYDSDSKTVKRREVAIDGMTPFGIRVNGLSIGESVVTAGVHYLHEGQTVRLLEDTATERQVP